MNCGLWLKGLWVLNKVDIFGGQAARENPLPAKMVIKHHITCYGRQTTTIHSIIS